MKLKPKHKRLVGILIALSSITMGLAIFFKNFKNNIVFFYTPSELVEFTNHKLIRIGGIVEINSIVKDDDLNLKFIITDKIKSIPVRYKGFLPNLFREGQGVVARGKFYNDIFYANEILAKHDENYMPKEVADKLKSQELWRISNDP